MQPIVKINLYLFTNVLHAFLKNRAKESSSLLWCSILSLGLVFLRRGLLTPFCSLSHVCIGWVAVTPQFKDRLHLRGYTPQGTVLTVRPPLLPHIVNIKGERLKRSVAYKTKKPPSLVYNLQKKKK